MRACALAHRTATFYHFPLSVRVATAGSGVILSAAIIDNRGYLIARFEGVCCDGIAREWVDVLNAHCARP